MTTPDHSPADAAPGAEPATPRGERLRRPEPQRTGPIRNASGYFRDSHSWGEEEHPAWREPSDILDDVVTHGVKLGYRVIDEHLRQGKSAAAKLRTGDRDDGNGHGEMEELTERLQRVYKDFGALCFDALDVLARSPVLLRWLAGREQQSSQGGVGARAASQPISPAPAAGAAVAVEVASTRRILVNLNLPPQAEAYVPAVHALHGGDPTCPPLTAITFRIDSASRVPILEVHVPDHQPPALYTGVVVDRATNEPVGTLSVRVFC